MLRKIYDSQKNNAVLALVLRKRNHFLYAQVYNADPAELIFREIEFRVLFLRYRAKNQNAELTELLLNYSLNRGHGTQDLRLKISTTRWNWEVVKIFYFILWILFS